MLTSRPLDRDPDVQGSNMRVGYNAKKGGASIEYDLYFKRTEKQDWVIPDNSTFDPPDWFKEGVDFVAWTENRGTVQKPDYEWLWVERASSYYRSKQSSLTRQIKHKAAIAQIEELRNNFNSLFELVKKNIDETYE